MEPSWLIYFPHRTHRHHFPGPNLGKAAYFSGPNLYPGLTRRLAQDQACQPALEYKHRCFFFPPHKHSSWPYYENSSLAIHTCICCRSPKALIIVTQQPSRSVLSAANRFTWLAQGLISDAAELTREPRSQWEAQGSHLGITPSALASPSFRPVVLSCSLPPSRPPEP